MEGVTEVPFKFEYDSTSGKYGYRDGADTFRPFNDGSGSGTFRFIGLWNTDKNTSLHINLSSYVNVGDQVGFSCSADVSLSTSGISKTQTSSNSFVGTVTVANAIISVTSAHSAARQCSLFAIIS